LAKASACWVNRSPVWEVKLVIATLCSSLQ
jgi:hypothetical protein